MSSSILSSNSCCGPVTGLLGNQTFLLHAPPQQKQTIISPPLWRTFYTPPPPTTTTDFSKSPPSPNAHQQTFAQHNNNNNSIHIQTSQPGDLPGQRMTLQKLLPNSIIEQTTPKSSAPIMSVSKLVRPTPKSHQHMHHQQQHVAMQQQHNGAAYTTDVQLGPMNLATTNSSQSADSSRSRPSSTTSSVDIESDDIPEAQPSVVPLSLSPAAAVYQLNYSHLYGNKSAGYHSSAVAAAAADTLRLHASYSYAAIAAVAAAATATASSSTANNHFPMNACMSPPSSMSHHHQSSTPTVAHLSLASPLSATSVTTTANSSPRLADHQQPHHQHHHHHHHLEQQQQHLHQHHHHQLQLQQEQKQQQLTANGNMFSPPLPTTALANGTYLNCKSSPASDAESSSTENYFKVPNTSGKEGSLKHRILTRPASLGEKEERPTKNAVISTYNSTANFKKGSYIELANGVLRRVEDMRTEDFIQCAERSLNLQLAESTIVKIDSTKPLIVVITFSYDRNRSKADIEVSVEHPFFVYGQGWASCDPEKSHKSFGLKCQRLQVGDICISLTQRPPIPVPAATIKTEIISKEMSPKDATMRYAQADLSPSCDGLTVPMTIKSELQTVMPPPPQQQQQVQYRVPPMHFMPCHLPATSLPPHPHPHPHPHQITYADFPDLVSAVAYNSSAHLHHLPTAVMPPPPSPDAISGFYQQTQQLFLQGKVTASDLRLQPPLPPSPSSGALNYCPPRNSLLPPPPPPPPSSSRSPTQEQSLAFDASIASRKRRWSAPEGGDCNEEGENRRDHHHHQQNSKLYKSTIAPVTS